MLHYDLCQRSCPDYGSVWAQQWEKVLHSNAFSHWLSPYWEGSLVMACCFSSQSRCCLLVNIIPENTTKCIFTRNVITFILFGPGKCGSNVKSVISKYMPQIKFMSTSCKIALRCMSHSKIIRFISPLLREYFSFKATLRYRNFQRIHAIALFTIYG